MGHIANMNIKILFVATVCLFGLSAAFSSGCSGCPDTDCFQNECAVNDCSDSSVSEGDACRIGDSFGRCHNLVGGCNVALDCGTIYNGYVLGTSSSCFNQGTSSWGYCNSNMECAVFEDKCSSSNAGIQVCYDGSGVFDSPFRCSGDRKCLAETATGLFCSDVPCPSDYSTCSSGWRCCNMQDICVDCLGKTVSEPAASVQCGCDYNNETAVCLNG